MKHILKNTNYKIIVICYCVILCVFLVITSIPYGSLHTNANQTAVNFSSGWIISNSENMDVEGTSLPYDLKGNDGHTIELRNTIPQVPFPMAVLETVVFQKDVQVFIDGVLVMEKNFEAKSFNQNTPGSGRILVPIPADSQGKEILIRYNKIVPEDDGPIANVHIINGQMNERNIISLSSSAFITTILMFFIGCGLFLTSLVYIYSGVKIYSLSSMSMFVITSSMWVMCNSKILQYFTDNWVLMHNLEYISFYSTPIWLWMFLSYNWDRQKKICNTALTILIAFFIITLTTKAFGICDFYIFLKVFHGLAFLSIFTVLILGIKEYKNQTLGLKIFFLGIAFLCFASIIDLVRYYTVFSPDAMAIFFIFGIIFMGFCLFLTFILMTKEKFMSSIEDNVYKELAFSDILTGLYSRVKWEGDLAEVENTKDTYSSILTAMIDVNDLKKVNDQFGHHAGDQMLKAVSGVLRENFQDIGSCYRLGGDEFCVVLLNKTTEELEFILSLVDQKLGQFDLPYSLSVAWGYATYHQEIHNTLNDVLREADDMMYESKRKIKENSKKDNSK